MKHPAPGLLALDKAECHDSLHFFVRRHWPVLEPKTPLVAGWPLQAICEHLEAVTDGNITRLLMNVPPGFMKSLLTNVFWPAWEWGPRGLPSNRFITFSYSSQLTERDNRRFLSLVQSPAYQELWGRDFGLMKQGEQLVSNDKTGWKLASSVKGLSTGERGDRVALDDPHNVKESESKPVREETVRWFNESMSNRLNDQEKSAIVVIMQRVHENDVSGEILVKELGYEHLLIPMERNARLNKVRTVIGWEDPREIDGELAWPKRFSPTVVEDTKKQLGSYAYAAQYQQVPAPRDGAIFPVKWWKDWPPEGEAMNDAGQPLVPLQYPKTIDFICASLDTAMGEKEENDYSALTVWGVWNMVVHEAVSERRREHEIASHLPTTTYPHLILMEAWALRLTFDALVDKVIATCRQRGVNRLIIEAKANGISVGQEMRRLANRHSWSTVMVQTRVDKVSRAYSVQHILETGLVYAPNRRWADKVKDQMAMFPKGAHDDLVDSVTHAWRHIRDMGILQFKPEKDAEMAVALAPPGAVEPLYDV